MSNPDWREKLQEGIERVRTRYDTIGRKTGAPFLAIVYPPEAEVAVFKEWRTLVSSLEAEFDVRTVDALETTMSVVSELGSENIVAAIEEPMPGSNPETDLAQMWLDLLKEKVRDSLAYTGDKRVVVVLHHLAALFPVTGPRALMQSLWDSGHALLNAPVVALIPGTVVGPKVYSFVNQRDEFMYRGDIV